MKYFVALGCLMVLIGCGEESKKPLHPSEKNDKQEEEFADTLGGVWNLYKVNDTLFDIVEFYGFETEQPNLKIEPSKKRISGYSGCNRYSAKATFDSLRIKLTEGVLATEIGCEKNVWENDYFSRLGDIQSYTLSTDTLKLFNSENKSMAFLRRHLQRVSEQKNVDTRYQYTNGKGSILIENSYPRGGQWYTHPSGERYIYAVFWTRITNNTANSLELTMEFPKKSYQLPSSPDRVFKLSIPSETFTNEKEALINYGLDLDKYLDLHLYTTVKFKKTIQPKDAYGFYVVTLFNKGVDGTLRAGLSLKEGRLRYRVNDKLIDCGEVNLKQLKPMQ